MGCLACLDAFGWKLYQTYYWALGVRNPSLGWYSPAQDTVDSDLRSSEWERTLHSQGRRDQEKGMLPQLLPSVLFISFLLFLLSFSPLLFSSFSFSSSFSSLISGLGIKPTALGKWSTMQLQPEPLRRGHSAWEASDLYESWCVYTHSCHPDLPQSHHKVVSTLCPHPITFQDTW